MEIAGSGTPTLTVRNTSASADAMIHIGEPNLSAYGLQIKWLGSTGRVYFDSTSNFGLLTCAGGWGLRLIGNSEARLCLPTCIVGVLNASAAICATSCVCSPIVCSTNCIDLQGIQMCETANWFMTNAGSGNLIRVNNSNIWQTTAHMRKQGTAYRAIHFLY